jgi:hypothetical protein
MKCKKKLGSRLAFLVSESEPHPACPFAGLRPHLIIERKYVQKVMF